MIIIACVLLALGVLIFGCGLIISFINGTPLSGGEAETPVYKSYPADAFSAVGADIRVCDLEISRSSDEMIHIEHINTEKLSYTVDDSGTALTVKADGEGWRGMFTLPFINKIHPIKIRLPEEFKGALELTGSTGAVTVSGVNIASLLVGTSTGAVNVSDVSCGDSVRIATSTGSVRAEGIGARTLTATASTGSVRITGYEGEGCTVTTSTGSVTLSQITADEVSASASTGSIKLDKIDGKTVRLSATTGSIRGTLAGAFEDYSISASSSTGSCNLPDRSAGRGDRTLEARTKTGSVNIEFGN